MPSIPRYFKTATPHQKPLMPRDESISPASLRKSSPCNSRSSSLDRAKKTNFLHWRADRARSASVGGDTLIPDTEPEEVDELWKCIRKEKVLSMSSEKSRLPVRRAPERSVNLNKGQEVGGGTPSETPSTREMTKTDATSTVITTTSIAKAKRATPYDKNFREQILSPRGIVIDKPHSISAFADEVTQEYECMIEGEMCEAEFASYAREKLFLRDPRAPGRDYQDLRVWKTDRMLELVAKPDDCWIVPPVLPGQQSVKQYDFDIRPDCGYWLSLQAWSQMYASRVRQWILVLKRRITCPYFFIEFKKDDSAFTAAENQIAAAASIALYNRFNLRIARFEQSKKPLKTLDLTNIKVYGVTFTRDCYEVWCIRPTVNSSTFQWEGCMMTSMFQGTCLAPVDVKDLSDWINEIHRWGLSVHAPNCENDVKICIAARSGGNRVSEYNENMQ
ncbi:hypothetical protein G7Y79_00077g099580 [Physcia stellaris]|nr:hypothetical protein G7Y79_00077g099580 [Physcia stellaris]